MWAGERELLQVALRRVCVLTVLMLLMLMVLMRAGDQNLRFYDVRDLRADGLFIDRYIGPGLEVSPCSLTVV